MGAIFRVNENDMPWAGFEASADEGGPPRIRYKALTVRDRAVPPVQYVEYAPGHADPVHSHDTGEWLVVTDGSLWIDGVESHRGSIVFVPRNTEYSVRGGDAGVRFFRVVVA